jgi:hypothetical protein
MTKYVKRLAVDRYLIKNPAASLKTVVEAIGCAPSTVHYARIRLGIPTNMQRRKSSLLKSDVKTTEPVGIPYSKKFPVLNSEVETLKKNLALAKTAIYGLNLVVAAIIIVLVVRG